MTIVAGVTSGESGMSTLPLVLLQRSSISTMPDTMLIAVMNHHFFASVRAWSCESSSQRMYFSDFRVMLRTLPFRRP